jgi:cytochrome P450
LLAGDPARAVSAKQNIMGYFDEAVRARRKNPLNPEEDLVSRLVEAQIDGEPIAPDDILTICLTSLAREFAASGPFSQVVAGVGFEPT